MWCENAGFLPTAVAAAFGLPGRPQGTALRPVLRLRLADAPAATHDLPPAASRRCRLSGAEPEQERVERVRALNAALTERYDEELEEIDSEQLQWATDLAAARHARQAAVDTSEPLAIHPDHVEHICNDVGVRGAPRLMRDENGVEIPKSRVVNALGGHATLTSDRTRRVRQTSGKNNSNGEDEDGAGEPKKRKTNKSAASSSSV
jgi:hypothetical protein